MSFIFIFFCIRAIFSKKEEKKESVITVDLYFHCIIQRMTLHSMIYHNVIDVISYDVITLQYIYLEVQCYLFALLLLHYYICVKCYLIDFIT